LNWVTESLLQTKHSPAFKEFATKWGEKAYRQETLLAGATATTGVSPGGKENVDGTLNPLLWDWDWLPKGRYF
jgi:hypothetical protein